MKQIIELKGKEKRQKIADHFGISLANVSQILRFKREGPNAEAIRKMAEENGGVRLTSDDTPKQVKVLDSKGNVKKVVTIK